MVHLLFLWCAACAGPRHASPEPVRPEPQSPSPVLVFENVYVIPLVSAEVRADQTVVIEGGLVRAIGRAGEVAVPAGAEIIDGEGGYLLPGLSDLHAHLPEDGDGGIDLETYLRLQLAAGVTTVRSMRGEEGQIAFRERIRRGEILGPHLVLASPPVSLEEPLSAEQAEGIAREASEAGYDLIKLLSLPDSDSHERLLEAAQRHGIPVAGHLPPSVPVDLAIARGQASIEHLHGLLPAMADDPEAATRSARAFADAGILQCPTLFWYALRKGVYSLAYLRALDGMQHVAPEIRAAWEVAAQAEAAPSTPAHGMDTAPIADRLAAVKLLHDQGAHLGIGADASGAFGVPGASVHEEMLLFARAGLAPFDILLGATQRISAPPGQIVPGQPADLVLLAANPFDNIANIRTVRGVAVSGRWLPRAALLASMPTEAADPAIEGGAPH